MGLISPALDPRLHIVHKTANETVNNSAVFQDDDELRLSVGPNEIWLIEFVIDSSSSTTADIKYQVTVPAGATFYLQARGADNAGTFTLASYGAATSIAAYGGNAGNHQRFFLRGIYAGAAAAGDVKLQWAQNAQEVSNTVVYANSLIIAHRIA